MSTATATNEPIQNSAATAAPKFDFPTWLPPMLVKELRQGLRTRGFVISLIALHVIMVFTFIWALMVSLFDSRDALSMVNGFFWTITGIMLGIVTPLRALGALGPEMEARNVDLLMLTQLSPWRIVLGKWTSLVTQMALLVLTLLPYGVVRYFFGTVDLLQDFAGLAWLFVLSCVMTAFMLWMSSLPKLLRVIIVIGTILIGNMALGSSLFSLLRYGIRGGGSWLSFNEMPAMMTVVIFFDLTLLLAFFLLQAVRRIAPPSENHSILTRLLGLSVLIPLPILYFIKSGGWRVGDAFEMQATLALVGFMLMCVLELANTNEPMAVHVRTLYQKGSVRAFFAKFLLPGWQSAALFTAFGLAIFAVLTVAGVLPDMSSHLRFLRILGLVWVATVLPAAIVSLFVRRSDFVSLIIYGVIQFAIGMVCIFAAFLIGEIRSAQEISEMIQAVFRALPVTSFWFELGLLTKHSDNTSALLLGVQIAMCAAVILFIALRSRLYWKRVRSYASTARKVE